MKFVGITGGVGAGKSAILSYLEKNTNCRILIADDIARSLYGKSSDCFERIVDVIGKACLDEDGFINHKKMAEAIFSDNSKRTAINAIVHPAVKDFILKTFKEERDKGEIDFLFLEAALLIDDGYDKICDELWYIYVPEDIRRARLKESRGYSDEKIDNIFKAQRSDEDFRKYCKWVIDNSGDLELTEGQLDILLKGMKDVRN